MNISKLKEAAKKAIVGPMGEWPVSSFHDINDEYITLANPVTIIELIERLEKTEEFLHCLKSILEKKQANIALAAWEKLEARKGEK